MTNRSPAECVILVPVGGSIDPGCESGLRTLEQRGYEVRRVRGFSQIDAGRNQLATDALREGFNELFWIDSDVVFEPDDVERLRRHQLPFVCGIYAKKSRREFACSFLPGTDKVVFGGAGGLTEILYAGFGFVHTHRSLYESVQKYCQLPECNTQFGSPMIPFFMPFPHPQKNGHWYLGEDYAFCERARQSGFKIILDTRIRLWHVGNYSFGWEDAGSNKERFGNYTFIMSDSMSKNDAEPICQDEKALATGLKLLSDCHRWPPHQPNITVPANDGWLYPATRKMLRDQITPRTRVIVEVGSWTGLSTRFLADSAPQATVIAIDHWRGSPEHATDPVLAPRLERLYEEFLSASWDYRDRIIPLRDTADAGLCELSESGIVPDLIYLDADHSYESVLSDIALANHLFPKTTVIGDDWDWETVKRAVTESSNDLKRPLQTTGTAWRLAPAGAR